MLIDLLEVFTIVSLDAEAVVSALKNDKTADVEDAMQYYAALKTDDTSIITRDHNDFKYAEFPVVTPD